MPEDRISQIRERYRESQKAGTPDIKTPDIKTPDIKTPVTQDTNRISLIRERYQQMGMDSRPENDSRPDNDQGWITNLSSGVEAGYDQMRGGLKYLGGEVVDWFDGEQPGTGDRWKREAASILENAPQGDGFWYDFGSFLPQTIGSLAAVLATPFTGGTSLAAIPAIIGTANIATIAGMSVGSSLHEYDQYTEEMGLETSEMVRLGTGLLNGTIEYAAEKIRLGRFLPKGGLVKKMTAKMVAKNPSLSKNILHKFAQQSPTGYRKYIKAGAYMLNQGKEEGLEELFTETAQSFVNMAYKGEDAWDDFGERAWKSFRGGAMMGVGIGTAGVWATNKTNTTRRKKHGVTLAEYVREKESMMDFVKAPDGSRPLEIGVVEIAGTTKNGNYIGITPKGKQIELLPDQISKSITMSNDDFEAYNNALGENHAKAKEILDDVYVKDMTARIDGTVDEMEYFGGQDNAGNGKYFAASDEKGQAIGFVISGSLDTQTDGLSYLIVSDGQGGVKKDQIKSSKIHTIEEISRESIVNYLMTNAGIEKQNMDAQQKAQEAVEDEEVLTNDRVKTKHGNGVVTKMSEVGAVVQLDNGEEKIIPVEELEILRDGIDAEEESVIMKQGKPTDKGVEATSDRKINNEPSHTVQISAKKSVNIYPNEDGTQTIGEGYKDIDEAKAVVKALKKARPNLDKNGFEIINLNQGGDEWAAPEYVIRYSPKTLKDVQVNPTSELEDNRKTGSKESAIGDTRADDGKAGGEDIKTGELKTEVTPGDGVSAIQTGSEKPATGGESNRAGEEIKSNSREQIKGKVEKPKTETSEVTEPPPIKEVKEQAKNAEKGQPLNSTWEERQALREKAKKNLVIDDLFNALPEKIRNSLQNRTSDFFYKGESWKNVIEKSAVNPDMWVNTKDTQQIPESGYIFDANTVTDYYLVGADNQRNYSRKIPKEYYDYFNQIKERYNQLIDNNGENPTVKESLPVEKPVSEDKKVVAPTKPQGVKDTPKPQEKQPPAGEVLSELTDKKKPKGYGKGNKISTESAAKVDTPELSKKAQKMLNELQQGKPFNKVSEENELTEKEQIQLAKLFAESDKFPSKQYAKKDKIDIGFESQSNHDVKPIEKKITPIKDNSTASKISSLKSIVAGDDRFPIMKGVFKDAENNKLVASDTYVLIVIEDKTIKKSEVINPKTGEFVAEGADYPNYDAVIPRDNPLKRTVNVNEWLAQLNGLVNTKRFFSNPLRVRIIIGDNTYHFNSEKMQSVFQVFAEHGVENVELQFSDPTRALVVESNKGIMGLVMPIVENAESLSSGLFGYKTMAEWEYMSKTTKGVEVPTEKKVGEKAVKTFVGVDDSRAYINEANKVFDDVRNKRLEAISEKLQNGNLTNKEYVAAVKEMDKQFASEYPQYFKYDTSLKNSESLDNAKKTLLEKGSAELLSGIENEFRKTLGLEPTEGGVSTLEEKKITQVTGIKKKELPSDLEFLEKELPTKITPKADRKSLDEEYGEIDVKPINTTVKQMSDDDALAIAAANDELRPIMNGVFYDANNQVKTATDAHVMVVIPAKITGESRVVNPKTGKLIEGKYPDYTSVVPKNFIKIKYKLSDIINIVAGVERANKFLEGGSMVVITFGEKLGGHLIDPSVLMRVIKPLIATGTNDVIIELGRFDRAIVIRDSKNGKKFGLVMPVAQEYVNTKTISILDNLSVPELEQAKSDAIKQKDIPSWSMEYHTKELKKAQEEKSEWGIDWHKKGYAEAVFERNSEIDKLIKNIDEIISEKGVTPQKTVEVKVEKPKTERKSVLDVKPKEADEIINNQVTFESGRKVSFTYVDGSDHTGTVISRSDDGKLRIKAEDGLVYKMPENKVQELVIPEAKQNQEDPKPVEDKKEQPVEKIEDFGEKIEGARKDQIKKYFDKINLNGKILSTIFPKPDIKGLLESGLSVKDVAAIKVAHEFATSDKKKGEKVIKFYAAYAKNILAESINLEFKNNDYVFTEYGKSQIELRTKAYQDVHDKLGADYLALDLTKVKIQEPDKSGRTTYFSGGEKVEDFNYIVKYYVSTSKYFKGLPEAITYFTEQVKANTKVDEVIYKRKLNIYYDKRVKGEFYIGYKSKGDVIKLKDGFKTSREARDTLKNPEMLADIQTMLERILAENRQKSKPSVRLKYTNETARERVGKDWRGGKDIGSEELATTFGFRAIEFGNWVNQKERQVFINNTYDSLMDLAQLLGISPKSISLAGNLGLTFGSRGSGKAAAHYEPGRRIINLTKTQGLGSLAHEWWHGIDNYFAGFETTLKNMKSASASEYTPEAREEIKKAFDNLAKAVNNYTFKQRSKNLDGSKNAEYYALPHEMSARAFENFTLNRLAQSGQVNDFIVNYVSSEDWKGEANKYPYPVAEETEKITEAFSELFETIQEKTDEEGNSVLFAKAYNEAERVPPKVIDRIFEGEQVSRKPKETTFEYAKRLFRQAKKNAPNAPDVVVVEKIEDLKGVLSDKALATVKNFDTAHGTPAFYVNGKMYVIAENIKGFNSNFAAKLWLHEVGVHHGLNILFNETQKQETLQKIADFAGRDNMLAFIEKETNNKGLTGYENLGDTELAEEYLAYLSKKMDDPSKVTAKERSVWAKIVEWIRSKVKNFLGHNISNKDVMDIVKSAVQANYTDSSITGITSDGVRFQIAGESGAANLDKAERKQKQLGKEEPKIVKATGIKPKNLRDTYKAGREIFGLNRSQALAQAIVVNTVVNKIAKNRGVTAEKVWSEIEFRKGMVQGKGVLYQQAKAAMFYSPTEKALEQIQQNKGTAEQFKAMLLKNGAKQAELDWMGFDELPEKLTKTDIQNWIDENRIEVEEVEKSGEYVQEPNIDSTLKDVFKILIEENNYYIRDIEDAEEVKKVNYLDNSPEEILEQFEEYYNYLENKNELEGDTKYSQYVLPGGENYKELLLTMPRKKTQLFTTKIIGDKWFVIDSDGKIASEPLTAKFEAEAIASRRTEIESGQKDNTFKSSHFDEPNILAHIRFNERTDSEGNKVLFIEEIQSDWGQSIKKKGVTTKWKPGQLHVFSETAARETYNQSDKFWVVAANNENGQQEQVFQILKSKAPTKEDVINYIINEKPRVQGEPDMPFKQTPQWVNLALRRMIRYAAENGFDRIAWTPGSVQAERYDLSKQVDRVEYTPKPKPFPDAEQTYSLDVYDKNNTPVVRENDVTLGQIENILGKEIAKKIQNGEGNAPLPGKNLPTYLTGLDLQVGGEGMKAFYDAIVPNAAKGLGKKFGAKVEETKLPEYYEYEGKPYKSRNEKAGLNVLSLPVTESMRTSALTEGMPLFQKQKIAGTAKGAIQFLADGNAIISALTNPNVSTPLHEIAHLYERYMPDSERKVVLKWAKHKTWSTETSEMFARGFEKYLATGKAPLPSLVGVFRRFKAWLTDIYNGITGSEIDIQLNDAMTDIYSAMLGADVVQKTTKNKNKVEKPVDDLLSQIAGESGANQTGDPNFDSRHEPIIKGAYEKSLEIFHDNMRSVKTLQELITKRGGVMDEDLDTHIFENLTSSISKAEIENFENSIQRRFLGAVKHIAGSYGIDADGIGIYLMAKHASERNKVMQMQGFKLKEGSGMSDVEAEAYIREFEGKVDQADIKELLDSRSEVTGFTLRTLNEKGLITNDQYRKYKNQYTDYVPLRGWAGETASDIYKYIEDNINRDAPPMKHAKGRTSLADNPLSYMLSMAHAAIIMGNKNVMRTKALNMVRANSRMQDLFSENPIYEVKQDDGTTITTVNRPDQELFDQEKVTVIKDTRNLYKNTIHNASQHDVIVYDNGEKKVISFTDPVVARSINGENMVAKDFVRKILSPTVGRVQRFISANFTSKNPPFIPVNWMRDFGYAYFSHFVKGDKGDAEYFRKSMMNSFKAVSRHLRHNLGTTFSEEAINDAQIKISNGESLTNADYDALYYSFKMNGGETGYVHLKNINNFKNDIEKELRLAVGNPTRWEAANNYAPIKKAGEWLEYMAQMSENQARFSTYLVSMSKGKSHVQSAYDAKNITVNFNRRGKVSGLMGNLYVFFNANVQGVANIGKLVKDHPKAFAKLGAGFMTMGFLSALLTRMWADDDDDENAFDKIPTYIKYNYWVLPNPAYYLGYGEKKEKFLTIPLPHGFRALYALGVMAYEAATGTKGAGDVAIDLVTNTADSFSPITSLNPDEMLKGDITLRPIVPSWMMPFYDINVNRDFAGRMVYKEPFTKALEKKIPGSEQSLPNVNPLLKSAARGLNRLGGGDLKRTAAIGFNPKTTKVDAERNEWKWLIYDWNPSKAEHLLEYYLGGRGKFFNNIYKTTRDATLSVINKENQMNEYTTPILRRFIYTPYTKDTPDKYWELKNEISTWKGLYNDAKSDKDIEMMVRFQKNRRMMELINEFDRSEKRIKDMNERIDRSINPEMKKKLIKDRRMIIKDFLNKSKEIDKRHENSNR